MLNHTIRDDDHWMRARDAETKFGYSEKHLRRLAQRGEIASRRVGPREVRLLKSSILDYKRRMEQAGTGKFSPTRETRTPAEIVHAYSTTNAGESLEDGDEGDESIYLNPPLAVANEAVSSQFILTDCLELLVAPPLPCVTIERLLHKSDVDALLCSHKIVQFFSSLQTADYITRHLGIKRIDSGRTPMLSHGDNLILVQIKKGSTSLFYVLVQFAF